MWSGNLNSFFKKPHSHPLVPAECCANYSLRSTPLEAGQTIKAGRALKLPPPLNSGNLKNDPLCTEVTTPQIGKTPSHHFTQFLRIPWGLEEVLTFHHRSRRVGSANLDWGGGGGEDHVHGGCTQQGWEGCSQQSAGSPQSMQRKRLI